MAVDPKSTYYDHGGIEVDEYLRAKLDGAEKVLSGYECAVLYNILKYASRLPYKYDTKEGIMREAEKIVVEAGMLLRSLEQRLGKGNEMEEQWKKLAEVSKWRDDQIEAAVKDSYKDMSRISTQLSDASVG